MQGQPRDALPLFEQALAVTQADPALTDLRLLLQINKAVALGGLDRYEEALATAWHARDLADQAGTAVRRAQAHSARGQLLFETGRWDDAVAEAKILPEAMKEPAVACCDLGIAAVIGFHRGEIATARRHLAAAIPHAKRIGNRLIGPLTLARSLEFERADALPEALAVLTAGFSDDTEELGVIEDLLADAVRLATDIGDLGAAKALAGRAAAPAAGSEIPHRQANVLYCRVCWIMMLPSCRPRSAITMPVGRCCLPGRWKQPPKNSSVSATTARRGPRSPVPRRSMPHLVLSQMLADYRLGPEHVERDFRHINPATWACTRFSTISKTAPRARAVSCCRT